MHSKKLYTKHNGIIFLLLLVIFLLIYSPTIQGYYVHHDDYYYWVWQREIWTTHPQFRSSILYGRPIASLVTCMLGSLIQKVEDANLVRFIGIVEVSLLAFIMYLWFRINAIKKLDSLILSILIGTLPSFQVYVSWIVCNWWSIAALLSLFSTVLLFKVAFKRTNNKGTVLSRTIMGMGVLVIALNIYQPAAMFCWAMLAIPLLKAKVEYFRKWRRPVIVYFTANFIAIIIYFSIYKIMLKAIQNYGIDISGSRSALVSDIVEKVKWFFSEAIFNALNLWNIFPSKGVAIWVTTIIIIGFVLEGIRYFRIETAEKRKFLWNYLQKFFVTIFLIPLSYLPNLVVKENYAAYRTTIGLSAIVVILLYKGIQQSAAFLSVKYRKPIVTSIFALLLVLAAAKTNNTVMNYFVLPGTFELSYIKYIIKNNDISNIKGIYVIRPGEDDFLTGKNRYDEFGTPSSIFWQDITGMIKCALMELGLKVRNNIYIGSGTENRCLSLGQKVLIIDMRELKYFHKNFIEDALNK